MKRVMPVLHSASALLWTALGCAVSATSSRLEHTPVSQSQRGLHCVLADASLGFSGHSGHGYLRQEWVEEVMATPRFKQLP
mmetsp:Transcript_95145/g.164244  ORF Transcript_95145/g.164244 Transcript_95145/m.164244 type:complete len:81 (-) Transcript_95145:268-510(-)